MDYKKYLRLLFVWSRKIHVWVMWVTVSLAGVMIVTGLALEELSEGGGVLFFLNPVYIRDLHRALAEPFALSLSASIGTGLVMWLFPKLMRRK